MTVRTTHLGKVVDVSAGQPAPKPNDFSKDGYPFIRAGSLEGLLSGQTEDDCEKIDAETARQYRMRLYPKDTILFPKSGMSAKIGRVYRMRQSAYVVSHLAALAPTGKYDPSYLSHWLRAHPPSKLIKDDAYPSIRTSEVASLEVPDLHPDEQRRIAAILDNADAIRRKREQALTLADDFLRSVFLEMFGEPNTNRMGLRKVPLGDIIKVSSGNGLVGKDMAADGVYPVYGGNGVNGYHSEYMFEEPQIVIGRVGAYCGAVHVSAPKSWVTDNALYIRTYKQPINKTYLEWALRFANLNQYAGRAAQPLISGGRIYEVEILVPEDADQASFHRIVQKHSILVSKLKIDAVNSGDLFSALSQRAFAGDL